MIHLDISHPGIEDRHRLLTRTSDTFYRAKMIGLAVSVISFLLLTYYSYRHFEERYVPIACSVEARSRFVLQALMRTFDVMNFVNAVISSVFSSIVLFAMGGADWTDVTMGRENDLMGWTVELVCGYLLVELPFLTVTKYTCRLTRSDFDEYRSSFDEMMIFHAVALLGLLSVLLLDSGFVIALWVVWSELTSVLLGLETFFELREYHLSMRRVYALLAVITTISFISQRFLVFVYLLWLCWSQFHWHAFFLAQLLFLIIGSVLNVVFSTHRCYWTVTWIWSNYLVEHESVWSNTHESIIPWKKVD